jgi:uncharacterized protein VirK/YbjX
MLRSLVVVPSPAALRKNLLAGIRYLFRKRPGFFAARIWQAIRLLLSLPQHTAVLRTLEHPQSAAFSRRYPLFAFKYLDEFVVLRLPLRTRRSIFISHLRFLQQTFKPSFIDTVENQRPAMWRKVIDGRMFSIALEVAAVLGGEGEFRLAFYMDGAEVYRLLFVFAAGNHFNLSDQRIAVVTGIQGAPDFELVKLATKTCSDIQPAHVLMSAFGGIAEAANISTVLGPDEKRQLFAPRLLFSYGRFFETYGKEIPGENLYCIRIPYFEKPASEVKADHRRRNRRKRQFRAEVRLQALDAIQEYLA